MNKEKLALFDLDGTLFDTKEVNFAAYMKAIEENGLHANVDYKFFCEQCNGRDYRFFLPLMLPDISDEVIEKIHQHKIKCYSQLLGRAKRNHALFSLIETLKKEYIVAVVTTASKKNTYDILQFFGADNIFDFIISKEDVKNVKPHPECFIKAMEIAGIEAKNTLIFEDSETGLEAAEKSGANFLRVYGYN